ncbi:pyrroline-5-carboxylate reductase [Paratractidigestivibacter sp.]|uniref:pyrroline-5-carboxylate reductase n=1 Tax=Paratractidigestivibacter sp. TaxID=2847316 RepID=UPI002ABD6187|nr:pyrroline-5-carboxylate reductase [Paratractidigestivibacter sp.]
MARNDIKIGIIGAGSMGSAIASGLVAAGAWEASSILVAGHNGHGCEPLAELGILAFVDAALMLAEGPDVVIFAVKPQVLPGVMADAAAACAGKLCVSIAAGVPISAIEAALPGARVVRVMPNLCVQVLSGASAVACGPSVTGDDAELACSIFGALGRASLMREDQLEVEGAVVGTAPAFFAVFVDTLTRAGVKAGMPSAACRELLLATMAGTATQLLESCEHPRAYAEKVTSPGGTTAAGLYELEPLLFEGSFAAVDAALARSAELAGK